MVPTELTPDDTRSPGAAPLGEPVIDHWPRATILVVDDEPGMRHFLEKALAPRV
ncbi:MAG: hypothetical protein RLZZ524_288, partial [Pseudomonadota bacterium]